MSIGRPCGICGAVMFGSEGIVHHLGEHMAAISGCDAQWSADMALWHRCRLEVPHDEPHRCLCGAELIPAPMA